MYLKDTIAAAATAPGPGGVGVIRVSGPQSRQTTEALFRFVSPPDSPQPQKMYYGSFLDKEEETIDKGFWVWFQAPASFTGEDVVELHCHGGMLIIHNILKNLYAKGIRPAERGEFTRRAFANGKLDLSQAEAVADLIGARSNRALELARAQHEGSVANRTEQLRHKLAGLLAAVEVAIDYSEMDLGKDEKEQLFQQTLQVKCELETLLETYKRGRLYREGLSTVILGRPNVGKSSLLNLLSGEERAIVTDIPGTTRDALEVSVSIRGIPLTLVDTAGIRKPGDLVEQLGVEKARRLATAADLIIILFDGSCPLSDEDIELLKMSPPGKTLSVINKSDLPQQLDEQTLRQQGAETCCSISVVKQQGIEQLEEAIEKMFALSSPGGSQVVLTSQRHFQVIKRVISSLEEAVTSWEELPLDVLAHQIRTAWEALGEITGKTYTEDLLDVIFSEFCLGK